MTRKKKAEVEVGGRGRNFSFSFPNEKQNFEQIYVLKSNVALD